MIAMFDFESLYPTVFYSIVDMSFIGKCVLVSFCYASDITENYLCWHKAHTPFVPNEKSIRLVVR